MDNPHCVTCEGVTERFPTPSEWLVRMDELVKKWKGSVTFHKDYGNAVHGIAAMNQPYRDEGRETVVVNDAFDRRHSFQL